jgi:hypothetical protein
MAIAGFSSVVGPAAPPAKAHAQRPAANDRQKVEQCSRYPARFTFGTLSPGQAEGLVEVLPGLPTVSGQRIDTVLVGDCAKCLKSVMSGITLSNGARFYTIGRPTTSLQPADAADLGSNVQPFSPPANIASISAVAFSTGKGLRYVDSSDVGSGYRIMLWSNGKKSVMGRVRCTGGSAATVPTCTLDHAILSSPHEIREIYYTPSPDSRPTGLLRLWFRLSTGEQVIASYNIRGAGS